MKKVLALVLCLALCASVIPFAGAEGAVKTGLAATVALTPTDATENKDGQIRSDVNIAAVTVDAEGKITSCKIDSVRADVKFNAKGELTQDAATTTFSSKNVLKEEYGMKAASSIGKEWYEQVDALAQHCVGKTAEEIRGIAVDDSGKATDADLLAGVTMSISGFVDLVATAAENAKDLGAQDGDTLYLTVTANMSSSKAASENKDGTAQVDVNYAAITKNGETITSCTIDSVSCKGTFSAEGKVTSDTTAEVKTKMQLGDDYGMKGISPIGKEWYEQVEGFCAYVTGKTAADVAGIAIDESTKTTDADLAATTTISIGSFLELIALTAE